MTSSRTGWIRLSISDYKRDAFMRLNVLVLLDCHFCKCVQQSFVSRQSMDVAVVELMLKHGFECGFHFFLSNTEADSCSDRSFTKL